MKIKIIIVDDNSFITEGMKIIMSTYEEIEVCATLKDGKEAIDYCKNNKIDVALLDIRMPNINGVEATQIITKDTDTKVLILTTFDDDEYILEAIKNGASGYLLKNNEPQRIREAIISIYNGNNVMQDVVLDKIKSTLSNKDELGNIDKSLFTGRELEIISLIAKGYSNKQIANELFISDGTVANYITSILSKSNLEHRTQIAIYYIKGRIS